MAAEVRVTRGASLVSSGLQTEGMTRLSALSDVSDQLNSNLMVAQPNTGSAVHHHGGQGKSGATGPRRSIDRL